MDLVGLALFRVEHGDDIEFFGRHGDFCERNKSKDSGGALLIRDEK